MVRNIKGWGHICDFRAKHINVLKSINLFHKIKKNETKQLWYLTRCVYCQKSILSSEFIKVYGLQEEKNERKIIEKVQVTCKIKFNCKIKF